MLFSIGALDDVWVEAEVFERQASLVKVGAAVSMTADYLPGRTWQGQVDYIYPTLDSETRTVRLRVKFENTDRQLLPNMFTQVIVHTKSDRPVLLIPREALIQTRAQDRVVLALGEGRFKSIAVKVGRLDQTHAEIIEGLKEGELVVSSAQFLLDSESSKTSDFNRIDQRDDYPEIIWVAAVIESQSSADRLVSVTHDAIDAWNMKAMTMNFSVADHIDIHSLMPGTKLHMQIRKRQQGHYEIIDTHILSSVENINQGSETLDDSHDKAMHHSDGVR
jgi:Cu(I)/Ag(I) efflux system membrane fusion protein